MFWGFQKGIIHVSIPNGSGVGSYNQEGLIFVFKTFWCVFYSRGSSIQEGLIFMKFLNWMNKKGKNWPKIDSFGPFFKIIMSSQNRITSKFQMEMFWGFQKVIIHVTIPNGCWVGSYNQKGLIIRS